jgi:hypothetical protein
MVNAVIKNICPYGWTTQPHGLHGRQYLSINQYANSHINRNPTPNSSIGPAAIGGNDINSTPTPTVIKVNASTPKNTNANRATEHNKPNQNFSHGAQSGTLTAIVGEAHPVGLTMTSVALYGEPLGSYVCVSEMVVVAFTVCNGPDELSPKSQ